MRRLYRYQKIEGYLFIAPFIIGIIIFRFIQIIAALGISLTDYSVFEKVSFIGIENYLGILKDKGFFESIINTLYFTFLTVPSLTVLSLFVAILINRQVKGIKIFRTIYFIPGILSAAAVSSAWIFILNRDFGLLNQYLGLTGQIDWLGKRFRAIEAMAILCIWQQVAYNFVLYLAALQDIPRDLIDSATIDGATTINKFFNITIPLVTPTIFMVMFTTTIFQLKQFVYVSILTGGRFGTKTVAYDVYEKGFMMNDFGYAAAMSISFLLVVFIIMSFQWYLQKKWVFYNS